jgi:hypothetical protein
MNEKQKEELLFEIRNRIMHIEIGVIAIAKYLANVERCIGKNFSRSKHIRNFIRTTYKKGVKNGNRLQKTKGIQRI